MDIIYKDNENTVELDGLRDVDDNYINDAAVTLDEIQDAAGVAVAGTADITLSYVDASNGKYRGKVPDTVSLTAGRRYKAIVLAVAGTDNGRWEIPLLCARRTG